MGPALEFRLNSAPPPPSSRGRGPVGAVGVAKEEEEQRDTTEGHHPEGTGWGSLSLSLYESV